ncbi:MAG: HipA domain-containing protein [Bacteroidales bacterium]|nr:HipA domain-containing protein [Bacteroidales bacterium]
MCKCLYCYKELEPGQKDFHPRCAKKFFGAETAPELPYTRENMHELASQVIRSSTSVTGVQAKMSLDVDRGGKNEPAKFTVVGLWGRYIFKPESPVFRSMPQLEDLTMKMAEVAGINVVQHTLIRLADGELGYLTKRVDRGSRGERYSMLDMCQLTNRLTEHKYYGTYSQLAQTIGKYSSVPGIDVQRFWEIVLFSWITGNSDMHCKNFSLLSTNGHEYRLAPAYDLISVKLTFPRDTEEMAMTFEVGAGKTGFGRATFIKAFTESGMNAKASERLISRICDCETAWKNLISESFLPEELKSEYNELLDSRLNILRSR